MQTDTDTQHEESWIDPERSRQLREAAMQRLARMTPEERRLLAERVRARRDAQKDSPRRVVRCVVENETVTIERADGTVRTFRRRPPAPKGEAAS